VLSGVTDGKIWDITIRDLFTVAPEAIPTYVLDIDFTTIAMAFISLT